MAVEYPGNAIPAPSYNAGNSTVDDELLFSTVGYTQKGVTLKPGQGVLYLGTFIKQDPATKQYVKTTGNDAEGLLRQTVNTGSSSSATVYQNNILLMGIAKLAKVSAANSGANLTTAITGARVNAVIGTFKF